MDQERIDRALARIDDTPKKYWRKFPTHYTGDDGAIQTYDPVFAPDAEIAEVYIYLKAACGGCPPDLQLTENMMVN